MVVPVGKVRVRNVLGRGAAVAVAALLLGGTVVRGQAAELGFLEMLFGARPAAQPAQPQASPDYRRSARGSQPRLRLGDARHQLRTRYAALPVKIRIGDRREGDGNRQVPLDMKQGAAAAFLRDETLHPGDIVVLSTGARVFAGEPGKRHAMSDFEAVDASAYVDKRTRTMLAGMVTPVGALPADAARRMVARLRKETPAAAQSAPQSTAMRVINPWRTNP